MQQSRFQFVEVFFETQHRNRKRERILVDKSRVQVDTNSADPASVLLSIHGVTGA
ncbi:hypothetical protein D3C85_1892650 [compost metagenome]